MIHFVLGAYTSTGKRPGSHLNLGTLQKMVADINAQSDYFSEPEKQLNIDFSLSTTGDKIVAQKIKNTNFLSKYDFAVCHKIPYSSVEKALIALMEATRNGTDKPAMWAGLSDLLLACSGLSPSGWHTVFTQQCANLRAAIVKPDTGSACNQANAMLLEFDASSENLFFGWGKTNSSISDNVDLHFNLEDPADDVPPTPRGVSLMKALQALEGTLGITPTRVLDQTKGKILWVQTSTTYGTGKAGTGFVSAVKTW